MTVEQAIEEVRRVGSLAVEAGGIRYKIRNRGPQTADALATLTEYKSEALAILSSSKAQQTLEAALKGTN
jgi:hypothetical protein